MSALELRGIGKRWGKQWALREVTLDAAPAEIVAVVGPSGAGKSTLLKIAAGIEPPTEGEVLVDGEDLTRQRSWQRQAAMVFESYVLYPHLSVRENIAFPLRAPAVRANHTDADVGERVRRVTELCEIDDLLDRRPVELSGGQRQRVALSRAMARDASAYLMDEPIAHLDAKLRHWLRAQLRRWFGEREVPTLWATPDGIEAMAIADRIAVLVDHGIEQVGTPRELYSAPRTTAVAALLGDPAMNLLDAEVDGEGTIAVAGAGMRGLRVTTERRERTAPGPVKVGVRPGAVRLGAADSPTAVQAEVVGTEFGSRDGVVIARLGRQAAKVVTRERDLPAVGEDVWIEWAGAAVHVFSTEGRREFTGSVQAAEATSEGKRRW